MNLSDTSTWLPLDGPAPGFDASKAPLSLDLDGRTFTVVDERGTRVSHTFSSGSVACDCRPGAGDDTAPSAHTDTCEVFRVDDDLYVFTWREKVIPCGSVTIADHRDQHALRSHGVLFGEGADADESRPTHFTFGARGRLLSDTVHPAVFDPARPLER